MTPRYNPWLLATVEGEKRPAVLVLSAESTRPEDVLAEVERVLTPDDPTQIFAALPERCARRSGTRRSSRG